LTAQKRGIGLPERRGIEGVKTAMGECISRSAIAITIEELEGCISRIGVFPAQQHHHQHRQFHNAEQHHLPYNTIKEAQCEYAID